MDLANGNVWFKKDIFPVKSLGCFLGLICDCNSETFMLSSVNYLNVISKRYKN